MEACRYGPKRRGLVGLLMGSFPLGFSKDQLLLDQLLGVEISRGALSDLRHRLSVVLEAATAEAHQAARGQPLAYVVDEVLRAAVETGAPTGHADSGNPKGQRGWLWYAYNHLPTSQR